MWNTTKIDTAGNHTSHLVINKGFFDKHPTMKDIDIDIKDGRTQKWWVAESLPDIVNHEYGHLLTSMPIHNARLADKFFNSKTDNIFDYDNLGKYASSSIEESLAEVFARYKKDGFIKDEWKTMFNKFSKVKIK